MTMRFTLFAKALLISTAFIGATAAKTFASDSVTSSHFGKTSGGDAVILYTLKNKSGLSVSIMNYGATIVDILAPDRHGKFADIALGFDTFAPYPTQSPYFGAIVGRYGNRIARGKFTLDGKTYHLAVNNGVNALHGGIHGFDKQIWKAEVVSQDPPSIKFSRVSKDGEENYPGNLTVSVTYTLNNVNELKIAYYATTDKPTILNITNHTYFNLAGNENGTILHQVLRLNADKFTPADSTLIPTGEIKSVEGTAYDFRKPTAIGSRIKQAGGDPVGYDLNFVLSKGLFSDWATAAEVYDPASGRTLTVSTDQPGIQFYSGNFLDGKVAGKDGVKYPQYGAFALETQHFPDSPNHANFPSTVLRPGDAFKSTTIFTFGTKAK
jgi:aldose 1-epimerase